MRSLFISILLISAQLAFSQSKLPVIRATSKKVAIKDGDYIERNAWSLSPKIRPDVFTADRSRKAKWVTFYTDIDSIRVKVKPGTRFNFVVILNGKDSCFTQIASAIPPLTLTQQKLDAHDTIPFTLTAHNAIAVKAIINNTDTVTLHFDTGSWDFRLTRDAILKKTRLFSNQPDALAGKTPPDYNHLKKVSTLRIATYTWTDPEIMPTGLTAHDMDGRFGWNLFEGMTVEIDYDHSRMMIHSKPLKKINGYSVSAFNVKRSFIIAIGDLNIQPRTYKGEYLMDTGSELALVLDSAWVSEQHFPADLPVIKTTVLKTPRGLPYEIKVARTPQFMINGLKLANVPASILAGANPAGFKINFIGNGLLKRFNMILDLKNDKLYLKPNKLFGVKYNEES